MRVLHIARRKISPDLRELEIGYDLKHFKALASMLEENHLLAQSMDGKPHRVTIGNLHIHLAPNLPLTLLYALFIASRCHLIVAQNPFIAGLIAIIAGFITRRPVLISIHGYVFTVNPLQYMLRRPVCLASTAIRVNSRAVHKLVESWGIPSHKINLVSDRVDIEMFNPNLNGKIIRERFNLGEDPVILFIGALTKLKGVDLLIKAMKIVVQKVPNAKLLIIGQGPLKKDLVEMIKDLKLEKNILLLGPILHDEIPLYIAASNLLVHPSLAESLGRVLLEAQAVGKPVVAFKVGGTREAIKDGETGILVELGNYEKFAEAILNLIKDHRLAKEMGLKGRRYVETNYEFWRQEKSLVKLYYSVFLKSSKST